MTTIDPNARVTPAEVKEIIETTLTGDSLNIFINSAHTLVQNRLVDTSAGLSADQLTQIELWLSAHFLAVALERQVERERVDKWDASYQGKTDMGLKSTFYGQTALTLDTSGKLATTGKPAARFKVFKATHGDLTA